MYGKFKKEGDNKMNMKRGMILFVIIFLLTFNFISAAPKMWNFNNYTVNVSNDIYSGGYVNATTDLCITGGVCLSRVGTGAINGSGSSGFLTVWNGTTSLNSSTIYQSGENLGFSTTDIETWWNNYRVLEFTYSSISAHDAGPQIMMNSNAYMNSSGTWNYKSSSAGSAGMYIINGGTHDLRYASGSGTADTPTYWNSGLYIDTVGKVGINTTSPSYRLDVGGTVNAYEILVNGSAVGTGGGMNGTGTAWYIPMWNSTNSLNNSAINQNGTSIGIGVTNQTSKLTIGQNFASTNGITVDVAGAGDSALIVRKSANKPVFGILPWDSQVYLSAGIYYDGAVWTNASDNNNNQLFVMDPGVGTTWHASNNGAGSWNVASGITLWNDSGYWKGLIQSNATGVSYFTGGNFGIGTVSPGSKLTVVGNTAISSGNLSVNGSTLFVNTNTSRVGIGSNSPQTLFTINVTVPGPTDYSGPGLRFETNPGPDIGYQMSGVNTWWGSGNPRIVMQYVSSSTVIENITTWDYDGYFGVRTATPVNSLNVVGDMNITNVSATPILYASWAGKVGIGTGNPLQTLHVAGNILANGTVYASNISSLSPLQLQTAGTTRMYIDDTNGNIGFGTSDVESWAISLKAIESVGSALYFDNSGGSIGLTHNGFYNATGWFYKETAASGNIGLLGTGEIYLRTAASGTVNTPITWINALSIANSGYVGVGTTSPMYQLHVNSSTLDYSSGEHFIAGFGLSDGSVAIGYYANGTAENYGYIRSRHSVDLGFGAGVTNTLYLTQSGTVGIGTTSPDALFNIQGGSDVAVGSGGFIVNGDTSSTNIAIDDNEIMARNNGAASDLYLQAEGGKVAIGPVTPTYALHVAGVVNAYNVLVNGSAVGGVGGGYWAASGQNLYNDTAGIKVDIGTTTAYGGKLNVVPPSGDGNAGILIASPDLTTTEAMERFYYNSSWDWWIGMNNNGDVARGGFSIYDGGSDGGVGERFAISNSGNVGIGTGSPGTFKLYVDSSADGLYVKNGGGNYNSLSVTNTRGDYKGVLITHNDGAGSGGCGGDGCYGFKFNDARSTAYSGTYSPTFYITRTGSSTVSNSNIFQVDSHSTVGISVSDTANVGIGTSSPQKPLHIYSSASSYGQMRIENSGTGEASINFRDSAGSDASSWTVGKGTGSIGSSFGWYWGANRMTLDTAGELATYGYVGNGNVGGTGEAAWFPHGMYSGSTEWLYGTMYRNSADTVDQGYIQLVASKYIGMNGGTTYGLGVNSHYSSAVLDTLDSSGTDTLELNYHTGTDVRIGDGSGQHNLHVPSGGISVGSDTDTSAGNVIVSGGYARGDHSAGLLIGSYNNVGANDGYSNPIYAIGSSYQPSNQAINNMYGIGYTHDNWWWDYLSQGDSDAGWGMYVAADGDVRVTLSGSTGDIWSAGSVYAGAYYYTSDERLKENITAIRNSLDKIRQLQGVNFNWNNTAYMEKNSNTNVTDSLQIGLVAQDVEKVFPEAVETGENGYKTVAYGNLIAPTIEAIKELANETDDNTAEIAQLNATIVQQQQQIDELTASLKALEEKVNSGSASYNSGGATIINSNVVANSSKEKKLKLLNVLI